MNRWVAQPETVLDLSVVINVIDRRRPRVADDTSVNHGVVVILSTADVVMKPLAVDQPSTFKLVCVRTAVGQLSAIIAAV